MSCDKNGVRTTHVVNGLEEVGLAYLLDHALINFEELDNSVPTSGNQKGALLVGKRKHVFDRSAVTSNLSGLSAHLPAHDLTVRVCDVHDHRNLVGLVPLIHGQVGLEADAQDRPISLCRASCWLHNWNTLGGVVLYLEHLDLAVPTADRHELALPVFLDFDV